MALVKYGGGIVQMSGSIAGQTFARNASANYVRARTKPVNPNTQRQQAVRSALTLLSDRWAQTLTAAQRAAWDLYGANVNMLNALGESINLSGYNHYLRSNSWLARLGGTIVDNGPVIFELPATDPGFNITASEATQQITWGYNAALDWADETDAWLLVYQGQPQNAQRNFFAGPWRLCSQLQGVTGAPPASPLITGVVFAIAELQHLWGYARILRADGRLSSPFQDDTFCAA